MESYKNIGGDSGVSSYEIGETYIRVRFSGSFRVYQYSYSRAGKHNVEQMKILARRGDGLNSYINSHVKFLYDK